MHLHCCGYRFLFKKAFAPLVLCRSVLLTASEAKVYLLINTTHSHLKRENRHDYSSSFLCTLCVTGTDKLSASKSCFLSRELNCIHLNTVNVDKSGDLIPLY